MDGYLLVSRYKFVKLQTTNHLFQKSKQTLFYVLICRKKGSTEMLIFRGKQLFLTCILIDEHISLDTIVTQYSPDDIFNLINMTLLIGYYYSTDPYS